ncbi:hypothetical protein CRE_05806 [Caenorhabditis remanei]|uniref:Uncharacterized protein n=1 Tax=Caenorhabditis remanei TaxID=31234 RepID=E3M078_CAERE|nr:hypothetical protein CRE_05806 [Caenorhabditis remanei]
MSLTFSNWDRFYWKYRAEADFIISEARKQNVFDFSIEYASGLYENFTTRDEAASFYNRKEEKVEMNTEDVRNARLMIQQKTRETEVDISNGNKRNTGFSATHSSISYRKSPNVYRSRQNGVTEISIDDQAVEETSSNPQTIYQPASVHVFQVNGDSNTTFNSSEQTLPQQNYSNPRMIDSRSTHTGMRHSNVSSSENSHYNFRSSRECFDEHANVLPGLSNQAEQNSARKIISENYSPTNYFNKQWDNLQNERKVKSSGITLTEPMMNLRPKETTYEEPYDLNQILFEYNGELKDVTHKTPFAKNTNQSPPQLFQENSFSCDSPGIYNSSFEKEFEEIKKKQAEELEERKKKRKERQKELEEEIRKMKAETKKRFDILWSCIIAKRRFEEEEEHWKVWIRGSRRNITNLSKRCFEIVDEIETNHGGLRRLDEVDMHELQIETCEFLSYVMGSYNTLQYDFEKLESLEKKRPDAIFIRVLMKCLVDVAARVLVIYYSTESLGADVVKFKNLKTEIDNLRSDLIYSTTQLREICRHEDSIGKYENVVFPVLKQNLIIKKVQ